MKTSNIISPVKSSELHHKYSDFQGNNNENSHQNDGVKEKQKSFKGGEENKLLQIIQEAEIDLTKKVPFPPVVLKLDEENLFFQGDYSLTIGKAKSRKTFLGSLFMYILVGNIKTGRITSHLPENKRTVLFFDTEQGEYHAYQSAKRVLLLSGLQHSDNFKAFTLRKYSTGERLKIIEHVINSTPNLGVVFIDGIRDLVTSINDEEQATKLTNKLMKWSSEKQIHINCVLHMNKGDNNARGHLGTEMLNKSLVTISVTKNNMVKNYSEVVVIESREKEPKPFLFGIDNDGLPFIVPESDIPMTKGQRIIPEDYELSAHTKTLNGEIFSNNSQLAYGEIISAVKKAYGIGENKAKEFVKYFIQEKIIKGQKHGNRTIYSMV